MYEGGQKSSYDDVISTTNDFFLPTGSKHCNQMFFGCFRGVIAKFEVLKPNFSK